MPVLKAEFILTMVEAAAVLVSAIAGMMVASHKRMDIVGAYALALVNAFGGGTIRDLLLDNRPFYWMQHWGFLIGILAMCVPIVYSARLYRLASEIDRRSVQVDAAGLALFTIAGVGIALTRDTPLIVAVLMGVVTGTMGGVMRDVPVNEIPALFRPGGLYATASFVGGLAFVAGLHHDLRYSYSAALGIVCVAALRLLSLRLGVTIPAAHWEDPKGPPGG